MKNVCQGCGDPVISYVWKGGLPVLNVPKPPHDLVGTPVCRECYVSGDLEKRIRAFTGQYLITGTVKNIGTDEEKVHTCSCGWETPYPIVHAGVYKCKKCRFQEEAFA
jgi:hypothetical protein